MTRSWILIANASEAKIYESPRAKILNGQNSLKLIEALKHSDSRKKEGELTASISGHGNIPESANPKLQEHLLFAKEIAEKLDLARKNQNYDDLIISAPAAFLGQIKQQMNHTLKAFISTTIEKDYTSLDKAVLNEKIGDNLT